MTKSKKKYNRKSRQKADVVIQPRPPYSNRIPVLRGFFGWVNSEGLYYSYGLLIICALFLGFALNHLGKFITTDETVWLHVRVPQYWDGLLSGDFVKTEVSLHPGITLSLLAGIPEFFIHLKDYTPLTIENYLFWWRIPGLTFNFCSLFFIYKFIKELTDKNHALLITGLIAFTPLILGMSKIVNSDSYVWNTGFISILTFLLYLRSGSGRHIIYCGISFALSLLSKFAAASLYIFFFCYLYLGYLSNQYNRDEFLKKSIGLLQVLIISWMVYALLYPATLIQPHKIILGTIGFLGNKIWYILLIILIVYIEIGLFNGKISGCFRSKVNFPRLINFLINLPLLALISILLYFRFVSKNQLYWLTVKVVREHGELAPTLVQSINNMLTEMSIPCLIALLLFLMISFFKLTEKKFKEDYYVITLMLLSIAIYKVGSSMKGIVSGGRYDIILFPMIAFITGCFYLRLLSKPKIVIPVLVLLAFIDIFIFSPLSYLSYSNDKYFKEMGPYYSWGMGGYELAQMANQMPGAEKLKVLSDYHGFAHFFIGKNFYMDQREVMTNTYLKNFDYLCLSSSGRAQKEQWQWMTNPLKYYYEQPINEAVLHIGSIERGYFKLVRVDKSREDFTIPGCYDPNFFVCLAKPLTIGFWLRTGVAEPGNPVFIGKDYQQGISLHWINDHSDDGILELRYNDQDVLRAKEINDNRWHHILFCQQGGNKGAAVSLFVDGVFRNSFVLSKEKNDIEKLLINTEFAGQLQDFRVYTFVLSQNQINAIFNNGTICLQKQLFDGHENFSPIVHFVIKTKQ
jgi:hypothetical protein